MTQLNFNATQVEPQQAFQPIPAGWYTVMMTGSEMKPTKDKTGSYLACEFTVIDGQYAKRKLFTNLNLQNQNPVAVEIAQQQLSAICHAVGVLVVQDSQQLHGRPLMVKVKLENDPKYGDSNSISGYKACENAPSMGGMPNAGVAAQHVQQAPMHPTAPGGGQVPPWAQNK